MGEERVLRHMPEPRLKHSISACLRTKVKWSATGAADTPWVGSVGSEVWKVRCNDFPDEPLYTLLIDGKKIDDFDDWPRAWSRPAPKTGS